MLCFFFFNDTATTEIYTLSLHDALPILIQRASGDRAAILVVEDIHLAGVSTLAWLRFALRRSHRLRILADRKSTRLNSSHGYISYAVFCLKKKKNKHGYPSRTKWHDHRS